MFWLIETEEQLNRLSNSNYKEAFIELIPYNNKTHPALNQICGVYIKPLESHKGYFLNINHFEALPLNIKQVENLLKKFNKLYVRDKKEFLHYFLLQNLFDITLPPNPYIQSTPTPAHTFFYKKYPNKKDINKIIPISKHYEQCTTIFSNVKNNINNNFNAFYNNRVIPVFFAIETTGLKVDKKEFQTQFGTDIKNNYIYSQYNLKTITTRPSNSFGGINFSSLNKKGERKAFIPRNDFFIEIDISAYHPTLLGFLSGYKIGEEGIYESLAKHYGVDREKAKKLTLTQMYNGVFDQYKGLEFFKKMDYFTKKLWKKFNEEGYIECPISKLRFLKENLENMKPQKLLAYVLQATETALNVKIMWDIFKILKTKKTKLVKYDFDAILLDVDSREKKEIEKIVNIFKKYNLKITLKNGNNYHLI